MTASNRLHPEFEVIDHPVLTRARATVLVALMTALLLSASPASAQPDAPLPATATDADAEALQRAIAADRSATVWRPSASPTPTGPQRPQMFASLRRWAQQASNAAMNPAIAVVVDGVGSWSKPHEEHEVAHDDDAEAEADGHDDDGGEANGNGLMLREVELNLGASVDPYVRADVTIAFGGHGVEVEEAFATSLALPIGLQLRAGRFFARFGRLNQRHPHNLSFFAKPLVNGRMLGEHGARFEGLEASWMVPLPFYLEVISAASNVGPDKMIVWPALANLPVEGLGDLAWLGGLRTFVPLGPEWGLAMGATGLSAPANHAGDRSSIAIVDAFLRYRPIDTRSDASLSIQAEWLFRQRAISGDQLNDHGGHVQAVYRFALRWETGLRWQLASAVATDPHNPEWDDDRQQVAALLAFRPSEFSRVRLQVAGDIDGRHEPHPSVLLGFEAFIGAHAAHNY